MTSSEAIERVAIAAYHAGIDPLDLGQAVIAVLVEDVIGLADRDPRGVVVSRKILGAMLDLQWQPPTREQAP